MTLTKKTKTSWDTPLSHGRWADNFLQFSRHLLEKKKHFFNIASEKTENKKRHYDNVSTFIADSVNDISTSFKHEHARFLRHSTTLELQQDK